ncbi:ferredoxin [Streptomyces erythrochromogenes]|uniref:ferredoxin n=1 Tax=Streptomyces erythrochromogenes TaxID=285574 RepID=UPI003449EF6A
MQPAYWDPVPYARSLVTTTTGSPVFTGVWAERHWLNVPGPFYGANTDTMEFGREAAPHHVAYAREHEFVYRQPVNAFETEALVEAARIEPYSGYACDGDDHWTVGSVRDWWRDRGRVRAWALAAAAEREAEEDERYRGHHQDAAQGHRDFAAHIDDSLEAYLRGYLFWLDQRREPRPGEALPRL